MSNHDIDAVAKQLRAQVALLGDTMAALRALGGRIALTVHSDDGTAETMHDCTGELSVELVRVVPL